MKSIILFASLHTATAADCDGKEAALKHAEWFMIRNLPVGGCKEGCRRVHVVEIHSCIKMEKWDLLEQFQKWVWEQG
jgi:hypothetical protein